MITGRGRELVMERRTVEVLFGHVLKLYVAAEKRNRVNTSNEECLLSKRRVKGWP